MAAFLIWNASGRETGGSLLGCVFRPLALLAVFTRLILNFVLHFENNRSSKTSVLHKKTVLESVFLHICITNVDGMFTFA